MDPDTRHKYRYSNYVHHRLSDTVQGCMLNEAKLLFALARNNKNIIHNPILFDLVKYNISRRLFETSTMRVKVFLCATSLPI